MKELVNNNWNEEDIIEAISFNAKVYAHTKNQAQAAALSELEAYAVERFGYDWDYIESVETSAFIAA